MLVLTIHSTAQILKKYPRHVRKFSDFFFINSDFSILVTVIKKVYVDDFGHVSWLNLIGDFINIIFWGITPVLWFCKWPPTKKVRWFCKSIFFHVESHTKLGMIVEPKHVRTNKLFVHESFSWAAMYFVANKTDYVQYVWKNSWLLN